MEQPFKDQTKIKILEKDPTIPPMTTLESYLRNLCNRGEISKTEFDQMRPKNAKPARVLGLPNIHKIFNIIPNSRPIIDTTGSSHYLVGKYLAQLLYPLTNNESTLKDLFEAVNRIQEISSSLFVNWYKYVSFDVELLFTNVPIKKTNGIILTRIYNDHTTSKNVKKRPLKQTRSRYMHQSSVFIQ